ncbi:hypothetical protein SFRURICE_016008 [Spodoptera frugiperda]|nr:hypothetical protein SFRURICE_016008 [Spodoptera frugiperda]
MDVLLELKNNDLKVNQNGCKYLLTYTRLSKITLYNSNLKRPCVRNKNPSEDNKNKHKTQIGWLINCSVNFVVEVGWKWVRTTNLRHGVGLVGRHRTLMRLVEKYRYHK